MKPKLPGLRRSAVNVFSTWLLQAGSLLFALISVPLVTRRFGLEGLGVWLLVQQIASHLQLLELGLASSLGRFLSRDHSLRDAAAYTGHVSSAIMLLLAMGGMLVLLSVPVGLAFPQIFDLPPQFLTDSTWMLVIAILAIGLMLPLRSAIGVLASQHNFALQAGCEGFALILRVILVVAVCTLLDHYAFIALSLAVFVPGLLGALAMSVVAARSVPYVFFSFRAVSTRSMRELLGVSIAAMVVTLAAVLLRQGSSMLAGYTLGVEAVPLVALPVMLVVSLSPFLGIANQLISPVASQLDACKQITELRMAYFTAARYTLVAGLFIFAAMLLLVPYLLPLWLGRGNLEPHQTSVIHLNLLLIFAGYCLAIPALLARAILVSIGMHKVAARGELISAIAGLAVGWALMEIADLSAMGMACGVFAAYLFRAFGILVRQLALYFEISLTTLYWKVWCRPLMASLPLCLVFAPLILGSHNPDLVALLAVPALGLWTWMVFRLVVPEEHLHKIMNVLRRGPTEKGGY